jgi:hypothetical protein
MMSSRLTMIASLTLVFLAGVGAGFLGHSYYGESHASAKGPGRPSPEEMRRAYLQEMTTRLKLDGTQSKDLETILDDTRAQFREMREKHRPEMKAIQDQQVQRIDAILNAQQKAEYSKMREERERRRQAEDQGRAPKAPAAP